MHDFGGSTVKANWEAGEVVMMMTISAVDDFNAGLLEGTSA